MLIKNVFELAMQPAGHSVGADPVRFAEALHSQDFAGKWGFVEYVTVPPEAPSPSTGTSLTKSSISSLMGKAF